MGVPGRQPAALSCCPLLELDRIAQVKTVEERSAIERHGILRRPGLDRRLEFGDVERDDVAVQPQRIGAQEGVVADLLAEVIEELVQGMAGGIGGALGAECGDQLVPRHPALAARREQDQESEPAPLLRHHRAGGIHQDGAAQGEQAEGFARMRLARGWHEGLASYYGLLPTSATSGSPPGETMSRPIRLLACMTATSLAIAACDAGTAPQPAGPAPGVEISAIKFWEAGATSLQGGARGDPNCVAASNE